MHKIIVVILAFLALSGLSPSPSQAEPETLLECSAEPTNMTIKFGDIVDCAVSPAGDSDIFRFAGTAGQVISLELLDLSGGCGGYYNYPCPVGQLFEPGNAVAIQTLGAGTGSLILDLAKTGTYTLLVTEHNNDQEESYRIALERLFPASSSALPLCFGCVATDTIDPAADRDFFFFEASQNDGITLTLTDLSGGCGGYYNYPCPVAYLYGPDRTLIDTLGAGTDSRTITLPQDGKYTIFLVENGEDQSESYNLALQCLFPADGKACGGEGVPEKCYGQNATIVGTNGDDTIYGTAGDDVIVGLKGNDVIYGLGGNDKICGGPGSDTIFGGLGDDRISGGDWSDALFGEEGNDVLSGGAGRDFLLGGLGNDKLFGDNGPDILFGGLGDDKLDGGEDSDVCDDSADTIDAVGCEITSAL